MSDVIVGRTPILSLAEELDPEEFRRMIYAHASSQRVRWWKAYKELALSTGVTTADKWSRVEQDARPFRALVQGERIARRYFPDEGAILSGDILVTTMPDEIPLADHDWLIPMGRFEQGDGLLPDAPTFVYKERIVRGSANPVVGVGTVASSGSNVTGTNTTFTTLFVVGDVFQVGKQAFLVTAVTDDTHLALSGAPAIDWNGHTYQKMVDKVLRSPVARLDEIVDADRTYALDVDYTLADDQETIQWLKATSVPAPGATYSVNYTYTPRYVVMGDMGRRRHGVRGIPLPQSIVCRLSYLEERR